MGSLQRDPAEVREFIDELGAEVTFEQFIELMQKIENRIHMEPTQEQQLQQP